MTDSTNIRILTNHWGQTASPSWGAVTTYVPPDGYDWWSAARLALRLYAQRKQFDCVVLGAGRSDMIFALLQSVLPFRRIPCVLVDCLWHRDPARLRHFMKTVPLKVANRTISTFVVWASHEIDAFSSTFNLPRNKFVFAPYHTTFAEYSSVTPSEGDYIFSGGNSDRDYETLIQAVEGLPVKVFIASTNSGISSAVAIPENVEIKGCSEEEYIDRMAGCCINVVPLAEGLLRSAGQQTFLNSMWLGKPTIVTDPKGAADYIQHGEDGVLVGHRDPLGLREAIRFLLNNPDKRREIGMKAAQKARAFSTEEHFKKIISIAHAAVNEERGTRT